MNYKPNTSVSTIPRYISTPLEREWGTIVDCMNLPSENHTLERTYIRVKRYKYPFKGYPYAIFLFTIQDNNIWYQGHGNYDLDINGNSCLSGGYLRHLTAEEHNE